MSQSRESYKRDIFRSYYYIIPYFIHIIQNYRFLVHNLDTLSLLNHMAGGINLYPLAEIRHVRNYVRFLLDEPTPPYINRNTPAVAFSFVCYCGWVTYNVIRKSTYVWEWPRNSGCMDMYTEGKWPIKPHIICLFRFKDHLCRSMSHVFIRIHLVNTVGCWTKPLVLVQGNKGTTHFHGRWCYYIHKNFLGKFDWKLFITC